MKLQATVELHRSNIVGQLVLEARSLDYTEKHHDDIWISKGSSKAGVVAFVHQVDNEMLKGSMVVGVLGDNESVSLQESQKTFIFYD